MKIIAHITIEELKSFYLENNSDLKMLDSVIIDGLESIGIEYFGGTTYGEVVDEPYIKLKDLENFLGQKIHKNDNN